MAESKTTTDTKDRDTKDTREGEEEPAAPYIWITADHVNMHAPAALIAVDPTTGDPLDPQPAQPKMSEPEERAAGYQPEAEAKALAEAGDPSSRTMHKGKDYRYE
jgi:hypothetical protein